MKDMLIVDCDVHVHELPEELAENCEMPWRKALENVKPGVDDSYLYAVPGISLGGEFSDPLWPGGQNRPFYVTSPTTLRHDLNALGVDKGVLFPDHLLKLALLSDSEYAMALARAYNKWQMKKWLAKPNELYGAICIAPQDPEGSAEEISRLAKNSRMVCVYLPTAAVNPLYGNKKYDPIYEAAEKARIPLVMHGLAVIYPVFPCQLEQFNEVGSHGFGHSLEMIANLMHVMTSGVPEKFPDLKIGFMEGGIAWVSYILSRLNNEYSEWRGRLLPFMKEKPSYYFKKNFFFATQPIEEPESGTYRETGWKLKWTREGEILYCPWHGSDFDLTNGRCLSRENLRIRTYPTKVVDGKVIIET